jgi:exosortase
LPLALFGILWTDLVRQLSYTWEASEQYAYGWFVPFLALALFWRRWMTRPAARPQASPFWLVALVVVAAVVLLPVRVIHEINQDWPLISWSLTLGVVCISLYAIFLLGGWTWVRHFAFPICFILVAVQWPYRIEHGLTQGLMRVVAGVTVELLGWFNIPAFQHGNLIEVSTGVVGIDEACSGIRSFQSTLMAALFLGELYRLRLLPRATLVLCGLTLGFCFNVVRTLLLSWQANAHGLSAIDKWHDPAGMMIAVACFFALWAIAVLFQSRWRVAPGLRTLTSPREMTSSPISPGLLPRWFTFALSTWLGFLLIGNELWYRSHELKRVESVHWWVNYPTNLPSFREVPVSQSTRKLLKYDDSRTAWWQEADGSQWSVSCFRWRAGSPTARMSARGHRPEYCMTGSGHQMNADLGTKYLPANGLKLPFRTYIFDAPERPLYVFFCLWEDASEKQTGFAKTKYHDRLRSALAGRRGLGQQTLEIILSGYTSLEAAEQAVRERLPDLIQIETPARAPTSLGDIGATAATVNSGN